MGANTPSERVWLVAEMVLLRAELAAFHEERQANFKRLATMWQPTMQDVESADDLKSIAINSYTAARMQNAEDLELLGDALALVDSAIEILDAPAPLPAALVHALEHLRHHMAELTAYNDLRAPLDLLRDFLDSRGE